METKDKATTGDGDIKPNTGTVINVTTKSDDGSGQDANLDNSSKTNTDDVNTIVDNKEDSRPIDERQRDYPTFMPEASVLANECFARFDEDDTEVQIAENYKFTDHEYKKDGVI